MKQYLSAFLAVLAVVSLAAAQASAPVDSAKASAPAVAPAPAAKTPGTVQNATAVATKDTVTVKSQDSAAKGGKKAVTGAAAALAGSDSSKVKSAAPAAPSPSTGKATSAAVKPDSVKAAVKQAQQAAPVLTPVAAAAKPDSAQLPPFPSMRNAITTEKAVKDRPDGVIPRPKTEAPATDPASAPSLAKAAAPGSAAAQPVAGAPVLTPAAPGKADSSALAVLPPQRKNQPSAPAPGQARKPLKSDTFREELTLFNSPTENLRTMKVVIDDQYDLVGMVYGEELGFVRILTADSSGNFTETWKSPPLNSPLRGVFVNNLDNTGEAEVVAYTAEGNIFIFGYDTHEQKYKTPDGTYQGINCMFIENVDNDPQKELLFITKAGKMVQFDPVTKFEEWTSTDTYTATDMVFGNVDNDRETELILNSGEVLNLRYKSVEWKMEGNLVGDNSRLYLMDVDNDGILELIVQYNQSYVRIIDVDQRREKW